MKRTLFLLLLLIFFSSLFASYMNVAVIGEIRSLNPYFLNSTAERQVIGYIYETLLSTENGKTVGLMAESWEVDLPNRVMHVTLKDQLFHDGKPVTAQDVAFSYNLTVQKRLPMGPVLAYFIRAEAVSERQVDLYFRVLNASVLSFVPMAIPVIPQHLWADIESPRDFPNTTNPVGSGSMMFNHLTPQTLTLDSFHEHPDAPKNIDGIVFHMVQDETMGFLGLVKGDYDYLYWNLDPSLASQLLSNPGRYPDIHVATTHGESVYVMLFNHRQAPTSDVHFRKAIQDALNYPEIVQKVFRDYAGLPYYGILPKTASHVVDEALGIPQQDLEKAKQALAASGYDGSTLKILCFSSKEYMDMGEYIKLYLSKIGVKVELDVKGHESVMAEMKKGNFDMVLTSFSLGFHPEMLYYYLHSSRGILQDGQVSGFNYGGYNDPDMDAILDRIWTTFSEDELKESFFDLQARIKQTVPMLPLCVPLQLEAYSTRNFDGWLVSETEGVFNTQTLQNVTPK